jgi:creatinine amidohydrolase
MTTFFAYDELTWPQVHALPRHTPLVIPLGQGYDLTRLADTLENPIQIGLLPPIPFGWEGSGLAILPSVLGSFLYNLLDSLRDDGFTHLYALTPQGINLGLGGDHIALPQSAELKNTGSEQTIPHRLPPENALNKVVLIPIGHIEQHGYHLPLSTDTLIIDAIGKGVETATPELVTVLPTMPYGVSTHRQAFAGTLNTGGRAFEDFWLDVISTLVTRGFDRFYLISGHGGNSSFLVNVVKYAGERHRRIFCATAWLYLSGPDGVAALEKHRRSQIGGMGHACELETSLILYLRPDLTHMERVVDETDFITTPSYYMDWVEGGALIANPPWDDDTITGAYGAGSLASAENGKFWLEAAISEKITHIAEINEQHTRREARRQSGYGLWGQ